MIGTVQGTLDTDGQSVTLVYRAAADGLSADARFNGGCAVQVTGTWTGTLTVEHTIDGTNWEALSMKNAATLADVTTTTANVILRGELVCSAQVRVRASAAMTGAAVVTLVANEG
jgi:hypothetical protein